MQQRQVSAAILTGGKSRRMGEPKALIRIARQEKTLIETVASTIAPIVDHLILVGNRDWDLPISLSHLDEVHDGGQGPADGIFAALESSRCEFCLIVACDMPFLDSGLLIEMIDTAAREDIGVVAGDRTGLHPLHAVYRRADLMRIQKLISGGQRSLANIARSLSMQQINLEDPERPDRHRWSVFNANTPEEIASARRRFNRSSASDM